MKKIITVLSIVAFISTQACVAQQVAPQKERESMLVKAPQIVYGYYEWSIETTESKYAGTALRWQKVLKIIDNATIGELIVGKKIIWIPIKQ